MIAELCQPETHHRSAGHRERTRRLHARDRTNEMSRHGIIEVQPPEKCDLCGKIAECRPYGPKGENVCFQCGMKNKKAAERAFKRLVLGETEQ
jgi:hypothetical protein